MKRLTVFFFIIAVVWTATLDAHGAMTGFQAYVLDQPSGAQTNLTCTNSGQTWTCNIPLQPYGSFQIQKYNNLPPQVIFYTGNGATANYIDIQNVQIVPNGTSAPRGEIVGVAAFDQTPATTTPALTRSCIGYKQAGATTDFNGTVSPAVGSQVVLDLPYTFSNNLKTSCGGSPTTSSPITPGNAETITFFVSFSLTNLSGSYLAINGVSQEGGAGAASDKKITAKCPRPGPIPTTSPDGDILDPDGFKQAKDINPQEKDCAVRQIYKRPKGRDASYPNPDYAEYSGYGMGDGK
jgi:hypothetical protein